MNWNDNRESKLLVFKKNILIISYKIPYPLVQGGAIAQFFFLKELTLLYDVTLCTMVWDESHKNNLKELQKRIPDLKIIYHEQIKESTFKLTLLAFIIKTLARIDAKLKYLGTKKAEDDTVNSIINKIETQFGYTNEGFVLFLDQIFEKEKFDLIQIEFFETLSLLPFLPKLSKKIVVHHEIRSKRNSLLHTPNSIYKNYLVEATKIIEIALLDVADKIIVFNHKDKEYLKELDSKVFVSPFGIPDELIEKKTASILFNKFIFIGGENHYPNKEALEWFLDVIYNPNSSKIPWPIYIIGSWSKSTIEKYKNTKNIVFTGFLPDLNAMYENSVMVTPILSGSGIRTKILQSFANKIPVMSTKFASEGLFEDIDTPNHLIHFESEIDFLLEFDKMENDMNYLTSIAKNGFQYFSDFFNSDYLIQKRVNIYND
ncbi:glycosyltransferase [Flavobacterium sp. LB2R40]|uniref:glycosyltransferase n=1 Tax=Flavobacterium sp. LB2R40 TaxID=3401722 RepID=UPI003AAD0D3C